MIYLDGGGVIADRELADHTRLRVRLTDNPADDVSVYVEDGRLHVAGQYARLCVRQVEANRVSVTPVAPGITRR